MSAPGDERPGRLDVPVSGVVGAGSRRSPRRAAVVVGGGLALVAGLALIGGRVGTDAGRQPEATTDGEPATAPPAADRALPIVPKEWPRAERLPAVSTQSLAGSPTVVFQRRSGADLEQLGWSPAGTAGLERIASLSGALEGLAPGEAYSAVPSPDGTRTAVRDLGSFGGRDGDVTRIVGTDGEVEWAQADASGHPIAPIWSPDGRRVLLPGPAGSWRLLAFGDDGTSELVVAPAGGGTASTGTLPSAAGHHPLAFSRDGRWLYATLADPSEGRYRPIARYSTADGHATPVGSFPTTGPEAPAAEGRLGFELDPVTGRRAVGPALRVAARRTDVRVFGPDGSEAFAVRLDAVLGLAWAGDGRLLALETDPRSGPRHVRLRSIEPDGAVGDPLVEIGPVSWAALSGVRDGHALLAVSAGRAGDGVLVVVVRLSDGATAALRLESPLAAQLHVAGWRS